MQLPASYTEPEFPQAGIPPRFSRFSQFVSVDRLKELGVPSARLRVGVHTVLAVAIGAQVALQGYHVTTLMKASHRVHNASAAQPLHTAPSIAPLLETHLMGVAPGAGAASQADARDTAPQSWVLTGTFAGRNPQSGSAILGEKEAGTKLFAVGDHISPGYQLSQVFADHVILEHAGSLLTVMLKAAAKGLQWIHTPSQPPVAESKPEASGSDDERPENFILADALLQPSAWVNAQGKYAGMVLYAKGNEKNLAQYGFKDDDVITAVNGRALTGVFVAQKALREMSQGKVTTVTVVRNGSTQQLAVTLIDDGTL